MWCVEDGSFVQYAGVEDFQDLEQQQTLVEGKSLLHFNYTVVYYFYALN
jgi:hypothetical protein